MSTVKPQVFERKKGNLMIVKRVKDPSKFQDNSHLPKMAAELNKNLDLNEYKPYIRDFVKFSDNLFEMENIFIERKKQLAATIYSENKTKRKNLSAFNKEHCEMYDPEPLKVF